MVRIVEKRQLTPITSLYRVDAPLIARAAKAGQFVILRVREGGERIPITITDYDRESGLLTIVVQEVGATTRRLGELGVGDDILDMVGPLGEAPEIPSGGHIVVEGPVGVHEDPGVRRPLLHLLAATGGEHHGSDDHSSSHGQLPAWVTRIY